MNRVFPLIVRDAKLLLRNAIFWVMSAALVLIVLTVRFVIPEDFSGAETTLIVYGIENPSGGTITAQSAEEAAELVRKTGGIGVIREGEGYTVLGDGLAEKTAASAIAALTVDAGLLTPLETEYLRGESGPIAQNLRLMPVFICFEALVLGFLMSGILLLGEKQERVINAYRISPGGTAAYIAGKALLFAAVGTVYALAMTVATVGASFDVLRFLLLTVLGCVFYTLLGICTAVFFRDVSGWFMVAVLLLAFNMLPMISYSIPAFSPGFLAYLPSYPILLAYQDILFYDGGSAAFTRTLAVLTAETAVSFALCAALVRKKLLTAGRRGDAQ